MMQQYDMQFNAVEGDDEDLMQGTLEFVPPDYYIFSGLPDQWFYGSLHEAMAEADREIDDTKEDVCIFDAKGKLVAFRKWVTDEEGMEQQGDDIVRLDVLGIYLPWETV